MIGRRRAARTGQSMIETTVLIAVVVMALVAMFSFMRNAVSHRVKGGSDAFGRGMLYDGTRQ